MRKPVRALFDNLDQLTPEQISKSDILKELVKKHVPLAVEEAIVDKKIYASLFEINDSGQYIEVHKNHWIQALETCLVWYVEDENYEMCTHIKNLIHTIQEKPKSGKIEVPKKKKHGKRI
jgi:hypothetical protein